MDQKHVSRSFATVVENRHLCSEYWHLTLHDSLISGLSQPGQFVSLLVEGREDLRLRRPFTVAMTRPERSHFEIVYQVVGKGTTAMTGLVPGNRVNLLGPLGQAFHLPDKPSNILLVGGGCGIASLWGLAHSLYLNKNHIIVLLGFKSSLKVFGEEFFKPYTDKVMVTTDDGSYGMRGVPGDYLEKILYGNVNRVYACGPPAMLKSVVPILKKRKVKGEVAWEEKMGCGFGVCLSCVVPVVRNGHIERQRVCMEGPVFDLEEIVLDDHT